MRLSLPLFPLPDLFSLFAGTWVQVVKPPAEPPSMMRFAGAGIELAGAVLVTAGVGYLIDLFFELERPWGVAIGAFLGFVIGMVNFIRLAMKVNR